MKMDNKFKISDVIDKLGDIKYVKELFNMLKNKKVSIVKKSTILGLLLIMIIYIVSPLDILPDLVPGLGIIEDMLVGITMLAFIGGLIEKEISKTKPEEAFKTKTGKSKIVNFKIEGTSSEKLNNKNKDNTNDKNE
ncbi:MAG: DUF1232 domain-containing protein [Proteocatella sp.]